MGGLRRVESLPMRNGNLIGPPFRVVTDALRAYL